MSARSRRKLDYALAGTIIAIYSALCLAFMGLPPAWGDEMQFADPAANLYFS